MRVCYVTSECVPFAKTGGLADVSGALPKALAAQGHHVKLFLPLYSSIRVFDYGFVQAHELDGLAIPLGNETVYVNAWYGHLPGSDVEVYLIDCPRFFHRSTLYDGEAWDEADRFILFQHAVVRVLQQYGWAPDVMHCNDWATALLPALLRQHYAWDRLFDGTGTLLSIHNIGYQGRFDASKIYRAGLSYDLFYPGGPYELHGAFCFLKAGLVFTDLISTVSPTYAREIQRTAFGAGLDGVLRARSADLFGVLNGIDPDEWHPAHDPFIPHPYDIESLDRKQLNKQALLDEAGLPYDPDVPVIGFISRLTSQKGVELLEPVLQPLVEQNPVQFVFLGSGEPWYEDFLRWAAAAYQQQVAAYIGYNNRMAHLIEAGADMFVMPSRYEPCGLNQMYSLAYGTVPIVRATGGLADTVEDFHEYRGEGNGFSFYDYQGYALHDAINRALGVYQDKGSWRTLMRRGMQQDFTWRRSADRYVDLYHWAARKQRHGW